RGRSYGCSCLPPARPLGSFQLQWDRVVTRRCRSSLDVVRRHGSAVAVARRCGSAVDVARSCGSAVDVARRLRSVVDVTWGPLALPSGPVLPPLVSLLLLAPPTCLALIFTTPRSPCLSQASLGIKAGYTLDRVRTHRRAHTLSYSLTQSHTTDNLEMPINLQCMSLDRGRKPEYPEETPKARGEHANSTHTAEAGIEPPTLE
ncbi:hypothetical protein QTP70_027348, partial [Hemibagrus guttatus]